MRRYLALALSFLMAFSGCATYQPIVWNQTEGPVSVRVENYLGALYLSIKNNDNRPLSLRRSDITVEYSDGNKINIVEGKIIRDQLEEVRKNDTKSKDEEKLAILALLFPPTAVIFGMAAIVGAPFTLTAYAYSKTRLDLIDNQLDRQFKDVKLSKKEEATGFIFFGETFALGGKLVLRFVDETDGSPFVVSIPSN